MFYNISIPEGSDGGAPVLSNEVKEIIDIVLRSSLGAGICLFGIITNAINITVFAKQGLDETVNITLFAMAISDLASVVTLLWVGICVNPLFKYSNIPFLSESVEYITGSWTHAIFVRITGWLTTVVTVERCLCVLFPLKIKSILTPFRIKVIVVTTYILVIASMSTEFYTTRLGWRFIPERNRTMVDVVISKDKSKIDSFATYVHSICPSVAYFILISAATFILVVKLKRQTKWRHESSAQAQEKGQKTAARDKKVVKMVITLAIIFIACLLPHMLGMIPIALDPEFSIIGKRRNLFKTIGAFVLTLEAVNSSINIFIYYHMSTKYRSTFRIIFLGISSKDAA